MSARDRLHDVQAALKERGVQDVKFFFYGATAMPMSHVLADVRHALQSYLDGRVRRIHEPNQA